jgi:nitrite reductase/ring-hydroxylating ferredoxin subunit
MRAAIGSLDDLRTKGCLTGKAGQRPVCVFWHDDRAYAVDDRCPHLGFPLHQGTVENGLLTCHWHHARFDLVSGSTLDPWADDVRAYPIEIDDDGIVHVVVGPDPDHVDHLRQRLADGLEQGLTLVTSKAVLGLLEAGVEPAQIVRSGVEFGTKYRGSGWGTGLTVLAAMANLLETLDPDDRPLALVHGLAFVSRDTRGQPPRFPLAPLGGDGVGVARLAAWFRRLVETRSEDGAERALVTAVATGADSVDVEAMVMAAITDHVFIDEGHAIDFANKALETVGALGWETAGSVLPTLVPVVARARRHEEDGAWRHPHDLVALLDEVYADLPVLLEKGRAAAGSFTDVKDLAWQVLEDDPVAVVEALNAAVAGGASPEQLGRAVAYAAALRVTRFHVSNDFGDWDVVHHGFTAANALHQALRRAPTPELLRGVYQTALKVYLDRFLNVPAARLPDTASGDLVPAAGMLGRAGPCRPRRRHRVRLPARRGRPRRRRAGPLPRPAPRGRAVPLVPDRRSGRAAGVRLARWLRRGGPDPRRRRPLPGRPHAHPTGAPPGRPHRNPPPPRRSAVRRVSRVRGG